MDVCKQSFDTKMGSEVWDSVRTLIPRGAKNVKKCVQTLGTESMRRKREP
jgi:hypothetical protein